MKAPRKADDRDDEMKALRSALTFGLRRTRRMLRGKYVAMAQRKDCAKRERAWNSHDEPVPMCTISHGNGTEMAGSPQERGQS